MQDGETDKKAAPRRDARGRPIFFTRFDTDAAFGIADFSKRLDGVQNEVRLVHYYDGEEGRERPDAALLLRNLAERHEFIRLELLDIREKDAREGETREQAAREQAGQGEAAGPEVARPEVAPCTVFQNAEGAPLLRFYGGFAESERQSLLGILALLGGDASFMPPAPRALESELRELEKAAPELRIKIFVTARCAQCPPAVITVASLALRFPFLSLEVYDAGEFRDSAEKYRVIAIPRIVINEETSFVGDQGPTGLTRKILEAAIRRP